MRVLVIGASGGVGGSIVEQLLALPSPPLIRVSSRDPSKATFPPSVQVVQGDLQEPSTYSALFTSVQRVFFYAAHGQDSGAFASMLRAMQSAGVQHVVFLSSKWVVDWPEELFGRMHAPLEDAIKAGGMSYTLLRPTFFASNVFHHLFGWMEEVRATGGVSLVRPHAHSAPIAPEDIAAVAVTALTTDQLVNAAPSLTGPRSMSQREQVESINRARESVGKAPIKVHLQSAEEWRAAAVQHMPAVFADALLRNWENTDEKPEEVQSTERLTAKAATTFEAWVEKNQNQLSE